MNQQPTWKQIIIVTILVAVLDALWIGYLSGDLYPKAVLATTGSPLTGNVRVYSAGVAYLLLILGLSYLAVNQVNLLPTENLLQSSLIWGGLFGLITYGIFNATNHAIFPGWDLKVSVIDTIWGMTLGFLVTYLTHQISARI